MMEDQDEKRPGLLGQVAGLIARGVSRVWEKATQEGPVNDFLRLGVAELGVAGRQGVDELGAALRAFPEAIQVQRPEIEFEPAAEPSHRSPSDIAANSPGVRGQEQPARQPAEIAADRGVHGQETGWVQREMQRREGNGDNANGGNDQNEQQRGRSLAEEQRKQEYDRGR